MEKRRRKGKEEGLVEGDSATSYFLFVHAESECRRYRSATFLSRQRSSVLASVNGAPCLRCSLLGSQSKDAMWWTFYSVHAKSSEYVPIGRRWPMQPCNNSECCRKRAVCKRSRSLCTAAAMAAKIASREYVYRGDTRNGAPPVGGRVSENCTRRDLSPRSALSRSPRQPVNTALPIFLES